MPDYGEYKVHPLADKFPLLPPEEFAELVASIGRNGLQEKIVLLSDRKTIADGRNRFLACDEARIDPSFRVLPEKYGEQQIIDFIVAANLQRRQLSTGQRAALGVAIKEALEKITPRGRPAKKMENSPPLTDTKTRDKAAKQVGVSDNSIQRAEKVKEMSPQLFDALSAGTVALNDAYKQARAEEKAKQETLPPADPKPAPMKKFVTLHTHKGEAVEYPLPKTPPTFNPTNEHISWAAWSWNPVTGCLHGCRYCYARELTARDSYAASYPVGFTPLFHHERLSAPKNTPVPDDIDPRKGRVFVCSMADLYGQWVPQEWIDQVHAACASNPQWEYLMLTKFPARYLKQALPRTAWIGTSVDEQKRVRIAEDAFREIEDVRVKWLSLEPLREPLRFTDLSMFDWIVIGAQTETHQPDGIGLVPSFAPPFEWVARLVDQAREAGAKVYLKPNLLGQLNAQSPGMQLPQEDPLPPNVLPLRQRTA